MKEETFYNLKVGKIFTLGNRKFQVVEQTDEKSMCKGCVFDWEISPELECHVTFDESFIPCCDSELRKDGKNIIFKEIKRS